MQHFFVFILHIVSIQKKEVKKIMENKKAKTLSATSTILLTIYTIFMVLAEVGMLSLQAGLPLADAMTMLCRVLQLMVCSQALAVWLGLRLPRS